MKFATNLKKIALAVVVAASSSSALADVLTFKVTASGGKYYFDGELTPVVEAQVGDTLVFDVSEIRSHPFYLTEVADSRRVFAGSAQVGREVRLEVDETTPEQLFYSCSRHANMGGIGFIKILK
jgi:plastocyanin